MSVDLNNMDRLVEYSDGGNCNGVVYAGVFENIYSICIYYKKFFMACKYRV